ncbi:hypothetical protein Dimus_001372 [Dionaea muscipula]
MRPGNMGSMANKLKHKKMQQQFLLHEHPIEVEKLHEEQQLTIERRTSPRKKQHGPQNLPVHETHTKQVEKLHERQELHERQQLTIERRTSPRKKHHGPQNSLVHETYTNKFGKVARELNMEEIEFIEEQEELNVDLPETNLKLGSTKGHDNANSKKRGRGQIMKQVAQLQTLEKLHEKHDKRKQVARELNKEETEFTEEQEVQEEQEMQEELNVDLPETNQELGSTEGHDNDEVYKGAKERIWKYVKDKAKINAANRAKQRDMHTCGPKSFARIRENLIIYFALQKNANEEKKEPSLAEMFRATRKRVLGRAYKEPIEDTQTKIARMEEIASQQAGEHVEGGESSNPVDPFEAVMGKDPKGSLRLYGRGVTTSTLGKVSARSSGASAYVPEELLKSIKEDVAAQLRSELRNELKTQVT